MTAQSITKSVVNGVTVFCISAVVALAVLRQMWLPLFAVVCGFGFILFIFADPFKGLMLWLLMSPALHTYGRISLPVGVPDVTFERLTIGCILLTLFVQVVLKVRRLVPLGIIEKLMACLVTVGILSLVFRDNIADILDFNDRFVLPFLLFVSKDQAAAFLY